MPETEEIDEVVTKKGQHNCITGHPGFEGGILNVYTLEIAYNAYRQTPYLLARLLNERYRYTA